MDRRPPDRLRTTAVPAEWEPLGALLGLPWPGAAAAAALLDPRGALFQRLEWVGDSVLDVLSELHVATSGCCRRAADVVSDARLGARGSRDGWTAHLDWDPGRERLADWLESAVGAAHAGAGWEGARTAAAAVVHPPLADVPLHGGARPGPARSEPCGLRRADAAVGAAVCEAAVSLRLLAARPHADEGELSAERGPLLAAARVATAEASPLGPACPPTTAHRADHVQARVGRTALDDGVAPAVALADRLLAARCP